jgi:hypothetical protein
MNHLAISADAPASEITPEGAEIANTYLELGCDIQKASEVLDIPAHRINTILSDKFVKGYITQVMTDAGLRKMTSITERMEDLIDKKMEEMENLDMVSSKDVADLLNMVHKMHTEQAKIVVASTPKEGSNKIPTNQQINVFAADDNSQYGKLMKAIIGPIK